MEDNDEIMDQVKQHFDERWGAWFECDEGWFPLIERLHEQIRGLVPDYTLLQVKEKFGGLRYYTTLDGVDDKTAQAFRAVVHAAEEESFKVCERCGQSGQLSKKGYWYKTVCTTCGGQLGFEPLSASITESD